MKIEYQKEENDTFAEDIEVGGAFKTDPESEAFYTRGDITLDTDESIYCLYWSESKERPLSDFLFKSTRVHRIKRPRVVIEGEKGTKDDN